MNLVIIVNDKVSELLASLSMCVNKYFSVLLLLLLNIYNKKIIIIVSMHENCERSIFT